MQIGQFKKSLITDSYLKAFREAKDALEVAKKEFERNPSSFHLDTLEVVKEEYQYQAMRFAEFIEIDLSQQGA